MTPGELVYATLEFGSGAQSQNVYRAFGTWNNLR